MYIHRIVHIYTYTHIYTHTHVYIYVYTHYFFKTESYPSMEFTFSGLQVLVNPRYYCACSEFHVALPFKTGLPGKGQQGYCVFCPCRKLLVFFSAKICQVTSQPMLTKCLFNMVQNVRTDKDIGHDAFSTDVIK